MLQRTQKFCDIKQHLVINFVQDYNFLNNNNNNNIDIGHYVIGSKQQQLLSQLFESASSNSDLDSKLLQTVKQEQEHTFTLFIASKAAPEISRDTIVMGSHRHAFYVAISEDTQLSASQVKKLRDEVESLLVPHKKVS